MRLIDADELMKHIRFVYFPIDNDNYILLKDIIASAPTIEERVKGKWIKRGTGLYKCSECTRFSLTQENFCPNCGADNREEKDDERH